jgi:hypothetical protein
MNRKEITGRGALIGKYFTSFNKAVVFYNKMSETMRKNQSVVEWPSGECMIVGNATIEALKRVSI